MTQTYIIKYKDGLHSRPALELIDLCKEYNSLNIRITKINEEKKEINCKNLIAILKANIAYGDKVTIEVIDSDENKVIHKKLDNIFKGEE